MRTGKLVDFCILFGIISGSGFVVLGYFQSGDDHFVTKESMGTVMVGVVLMLGSFLIGMMFLSSQAKSVFNKNGLDWRKEVMDSDLITE